MRPPWTAPNVYAEFQVERKAVPALVFIEGALPERVTGDSLFRRVLALHEPLSMMTQRFTDRTAYFLDANTSFLSAAESVRWQDTAGTHEGEGLLTLVVSRRGDRWVIRAYRG